MLDVNKTIRDYIQKMGLNVASFARMVNINPKLLYSWMNGKHEMRPKSALKIERLTKCQIQYEQLTTKPRPKIPLRGKQLEFPE